MTHRYQGFSDRRLLTSLHASYALGTPLLGGVEIDLPPVEEEQKKQPEKRIKVGFVSSHFRRHSICKVTVLSYERW